MPDELRAVMPDGWMYCGCWRFDEKRFVWLCGGCERCAGSGYMLFL